MTDFTHHSEPGSGRPLLLLHSTGGDERQLVGLGRVLAPGAPLLSPRGQVLESGMPRFFRRFSDGAFDIDDLVARAQELARWVDAQAAEPPVAVGYSNGANIAAAVLLLSPHTLAGAMLVRPMLPFEPGRLPVPPDLAGKRVLLLSGLADPTVPDGQPDRLATVLREFGADVTLAWQAGGHELGASDVAAMRSWLSSSGLA